MRANMATLEERLRAERQRLEDEQHERELEQEQRERANANNGNGHNDEAPWPEPDEGRPEPGQVPPPQKEPLKPFDLVLASTFDGKFVPQRRWLVHDRMPMRNVTLLSGDGAVGKHNNRVAVSVRRS